MKRCPNFNSAEWKDLKKELGELEAFKSWYQKGGDFGLDKNFKLTGDEGNPIVEDFKSYQADQMRLAALDKESVNHYVMPGGFGIKVNPDIHELIKQLDIEDKVQYNKFLTDNLYTNKDNPVTTELNRNASMLAKELGREDMVNMARLISKYLVKNQTLTSNVEDKFDNSISKDTRAYYSTAGNSINFSRENIGTSTLEDETGTVLEELFHGLTVQPFHKLDNKLNLDPDEKEFVDKVNTYYNVFKRSLGADTSKYRFKNAEEFLVGALIDKDFKDHLKSLATADQKQDNFLVSMMKSIGKAFLRLLGIKPTDKEINEVDKSKWEDNLFKATSDYLSRMDTVSRRNGLREEGRNYGMSFSVTSEDANKDSYEKMKGRFTDKMREDIKQTIKKSVDLIQNASSILREGSEEYKRIFRQLNKLEDPAYNLDQIDFFFDLTEGVGAVINTVAEKIDKLHNDDTLTDQDFKLAEYSKLVSTKRNLEPVVDEIGKIRNSLKRIGAKEPVKEIEEMLKQMAIIESQYSDGIFPLVTDKLTDVVGPGERKAIQTSNEQIDALKQSLEKATKSGATARAKVIQKELNKEIDELGKVYTLNSDKIESWLRGEMGDTGVFMAWAMAGVSSKHPVVAGVSKYIRDKMAAPAPKIVNDLQNPMQSAVEEYEKNTGRSRNDIKAFNEPLIQTHDEIKGINDDGSFNKKKVFSLLHEFNGNHIVELQRFTRELGNLRDLKSKLENTSNAPIEDIRNLEKQMKDLAEERRQFKRDYMEQPFKPEVHEAMDMIYKDLGGYTAWDYLKTRYENIEAIEEKIDQESDPGKISELYDQLDDATIDLKRQSSLYEKSPDSREFNVAKVLKERNALMSKYSTFELTKKGEAKFNADMSRLKRQFDKGEITRENYIREIEANTVTELTKEYWDEKKSLISEMASILKDLGVKTDKNEEMSSLYNDLEDIVKPHRDSNGIINAQEMSDKSLIDAKGVEEKIERAKDMIPNIMGLTKIERVELSNLYSQISEIDEQIIRGITNDQVNNLESLRSGVADKIAAIESRKKNLDKKLLAKYFAAIKKLSDLDRTTETSYYLDQVRGETDQAKSKVDLASMPDKFTYDGKRYVKSGDVWQVIGTKGPEAIEKGSVENKWKERTAEITLKSSDWWKNNHITRTKWVVNPNHDPAAGNYSGEWEQVEEPTYPWRQTRPVDSKYINENQPSIKYKKRIIKDEYKNANYKEDVTGVPRPKIEGAKDDRFINKDYFNLKSSRNAVDQATFKYLQHLTDTHLKSQESLPYGKRPGYKLPGIRQSWVERFLGTSLTDKADTLFERIGQIKRLWNDDIARNPQDKDILFGYNDDINGIVPRKFLGDIEPEDQSIDLSRIILTSSIDWMVAKQLQDTLPFLNAVRDIMNDKANMPVKTSKGVIQSIKRKFSRKGQEIAQRQSYSNAAMQINEIIKTMIYGEQMKDTPITKFVNTTLGIGAKLLLGFNVASSLQNYANAFTQTMLETESKRSGNFNITEALKAKRIYYGAMHELMADLGKVGNKSYINQFFDYFGGINMKALSHDKTFAHKAVREFVSSIATPNQITEHMLNYEMALAVAQGYRVPGIENGVEKSLPIFDAFTLHDGKIKVKEGFRVTETDRQEMVSRLNSTARRVNGEYGDMIVAQKYTLGKAALFMNRYVVPFTVKRYGSRSFDIQDGIRDEGYWRLLGKVIVKDVQSKSLPLVAGWKYYTPAEKVAIKRAATEFGFTVMFWGMLGLLGGNDDKHLKDNGAFANNLIYVLKGIQQQNEAFMPVPGVGFDDLLRKIQNPFPILGKVKNLVGLVQDMSHTLYYEMGLPGVDENDVFFTKAQGWHKPGDMKITTDLEKLLAIPYRVLQWTHPDQAVRNQDLISRIK